MALTLRIHRSSHLSCPKHRRFNPELHGAGAIRGACRSCQALYDVYRAYLKVEAELRAFDGVVEESASTVCSERTEIAA